MKICRVCQSPITKPDYADPAPAMSSLTTLIDVPTEVYICDTCSHIQSPNLPDVKAFYDNEYRISLQSDEHDQLYEVKREVPIFRTDRQAQIVLDLGLPDEAAVLDFGAAKAATLRKVCDHREDIIPYVFDVSEDYRPHWEEWIDEEHQATYELPERWKERFDLITAHFVIEHVAEPVTVLKELASCLKPGGKLFFSVPDPMGNSGDLLVVDHLNHFTEHSIKKALALSGLELLEVDQDRFRGAHCVLAARSSEIKDDLSDIDVKQTISLARKRLMWWSDALRNLDDKSDAAIYGAGFYGTLIASRLKHEPICFLDRNPHMQGKKHLGLDILAPEACPSEVKIVHAGLNPDHARNILTESSNWLPLGASFSYLES